MRPIFLILTTLFISFSSPAQVDSVSHRLFFIGDGGELVGERHPVIDWLQKNVDWNDEKNTAVFLGDNIYPLGLPMEGEPDYPYYKRIIDYQMDLVRGKRGRAFFVMGNHDWKNGKIGGWQQALNQVDHINGTGGDNIQALPTSGCPGPVAVDLNDKVVLVMMDSQWFLHVHEKPGPGSNCGATTIDEFTTELREIAATHPNQLMVLVMHHPMYSFGVHGGDYSWKEHLFPLTALNKNLYVPLPVLGSIYPIARGVFGNIQDVNHPLYQTMVEAIEPVLKDHPNAMAVAGHDHSLQLVMKDSIPYIVSGSASNLSRVKRPRVGELMFSDLNFGFVLVEVRKSGRVETRFYNVQSAGMDQPTFTQQLKTIDTLPAVVHRDSIPNLPDSVVVAANPDLRGNGFRRFFIGNNYRKEWTTPVKVPVLDLGMEAGGLTPERLGGGKQTRSLRLVDSAGKEWALRSVEKFPEAAIPADLRSPFASAIVEDGISASYPYASLSTNVLSEAVGSPYLRRRLVYVPDDPRLGRFRSTFRNTMAILEEREPSNVGKTYNTDELVLRLAKDNDDHVDQQGVLKARLLDNFYMDFDRHEDQWRWATRDTGKGKIYYVIPRDQDQAFYVNEGVVPKFARKPWLVPELEGFDEDAENIRTFNRPARNFDRFFLNELDWSDWKLQIDTFLSRMTDPVIEEALRQQPPELHGYRLPWIVQRLKERRQYFEGEMRTYYKFISREVNIVGTNQRELFTIRKEEEGSVQVTVNKIDTLGRISSTIYNRLFDPEVTREIRIYGLEDADSFAISGGASPIRIRMIGGPGEDFFGNEGTGGKLLVYDVSFEENRFGGNEAGLRKQITADPRNNMYNRNFFKYDFLNPGLSIGYNVDDGISLGGQLDVTLHGFRKEPFAARHSLRARRALRTNSLYFRYAGEFTQVFGPHDLLLRADVRAPINVTNFFGLGNDTRFDKRVSEEYYRARYDIINASALARRKPQSWMRLNFGASFQHFKLQEDENRGKFVLNTAVNNLDPDNLFTPKNFVGPEVGLEINSQNNRVVPTRGFVLDAGARSLFGINEHSANHLTQLRWDMRLFASFESKAKLVYAFRLGVGHNIGDFEFPQAQYLGGTENLRGYRRDRFAGRTMLFNNSEIRFKVADFSTYLFPGSFGLFVFNDVGRVWLDGEESEDWHVGNGGGIWVAPVRRFVITAAATRSKEEKLLPYVTFGFQF